MNKHNHLMIDLETLATTPNAAVMSIGACFFSLDEEGFLPFHIILGKEGVKQQVKRFNRYIDPSTIAWWSMQSTEAKALLHEDGIDYVEGLYQFFNWLNEDKGRDLSKLCVWSHGASFDVPIVESMFDDLGHDVPWRFWNIRDTRTLFDITSITPDRSEGTHHNAMDDAIQQAKAVQKAYGRLMEIKECWSKYGQPKDQQAV